MYFKRLKDLRIDNDYLQKDIANLLNISQQYYSKYELGSFTIPTEQLIKLMSIGLIEKEAEEAIIRGFLK